jgi:hypothetical protein
MTGNNTTFCNSTIFTGTAWNAVASGTWFLAYGGNIQTVTHLFGQNYATVTGGGCLACPATPTTTTAAPTTTTTLPPADHYYFVRAYNCGDCSFAFDTYARMAGAGIIGKVYREPGLISFFSYELLNTTPITSGTDLLNVPYNTCSEACAGVPATTTTTTAGPTTTTTTGAGTLFYITNSSLDIVITDVKVNGVSLTGLSGPGFPVSSGDTTTGYSNQLGYQNVDIYYYNAITGQHIEGYDSDLTFYCNATVGTGGHISQFGGAYVGSGTFQIYALDGVC